MENKNYNLSGIGSQLEGILKDIIKDALTEALKCIEEETPRYPERISVEQASELTGYTRNSIYQMHSRGQIPGALKVGGKLLFDTATLREWVENGGRTI